jgi:hypothetical protein
MHKTLVIGAAALLALLAVGLVLRRHDDRGVIDKERTAASSAGDIRASARDRTSRTGNPERTGPVQPSTAERLRHRSSRAEPAVVGGEDADAADEGPAGPVPRARRAAHAAGGSDVSGSPSGTLAVDRTLPAGGGSALGSRRPATNDGGAAAADPGTQGVQESATEPEATDKNAPVLSLFTDDSSRPPDEGAIQENVSIDRDGARFNRDSEFAVPVGDKLSGDAGSISFWVRPDGTVDSSTNAALLQLLSPHEYENRLQVWQDGTTIRVVFADSAGTESGVEYASSSWQDGEWRQVAVAWGDGKDALYVNGNLAGEAQYQNGFEVKPNAMLHIGSTSDADGRSLNGAIQGFQLYDHKVTPQEVAALSAQRPH